MSDKFQNHDKKIPKIIPFFYFLPSLLKIILIFQRPHRNITFSQGKIGKQTPVIPCFIPNASVKISVDLSLR